MGKEMTTSATSSLKKIEQEPSPCLAGANSNETLPDPNPQPVFFPGVGSAHNSFNHLSEIEHL
jgi:hypothetical protein